MIHVHRFNHGALCTEVPIHLGNIVLPAIAPEPKPSEIPAVDHPKPASPPTPEELAAAKIAAKCAALAHGQSMILKCPSGFTKDHFINALQKHSFSRFAVHQDDPTHFLIKVY